MTEKKHIKTYTSDDVDVTYDLQRCIHAEQCIHHLRAVFDISKRPWIQPAEASADDIAHTITLCPSGALHYNRKDGVANEAIPSENVLRLTSDGPTYISGDVHIVKEDGTEILQDTRMALCRCGASTNKPFCDDSHYSIEFKATDKLADNLQDSAERDGASQLTITPTLNGPVHIEGNFTLISTDGKTQYTGTDAWLCRCGHSNNKPFCDDSHIAANFQSE